jgi:hypothetical protein
MAWKTGGRAASFPQMLLGSGFGSALTKGRDHRQQQQGPHADGSAEGRVRIDWPVLLSQVVPGSSLASALPPNPTTLGPTDVLSHQAKGVQGEHLCHTQSELQQ